MKWISVKDELPEEIGLYAIYIYRPEQKSLGFFDSIPAQTKIKWAYWTWQKTYVCNETNSDITYNKEWGFFETIQQLTPIKDCTHWMPFPEPPEKKE